jgi:hypothetical protein
MVPEPVGGVTFQSSTVEKRRSKLDQLVESEGIDSLEAFLQDNAHDSVVPGKLSRSAERS